MNKLRTVGPGQFTYEGNFYDAIVRFPYGILGVKKLDSCCEDLVLVKRGGNHVRIVGQAKAARTKMVRTAAAFCVTESQAFHDLGAGDSDWPMPDGQTSKVFDPKNVPGTSGGVYYRALALTGVGCVSYSHGPLTGPHRMRVALWPEQVTGEYLWADASKKLSDKYPLNFQTIEPTHMSYTNQNINQATAVLARGIDALLNVKTIF